MKKVKRALCVVFSAAMCASLCACSTKTSSAGKTQNGQEVRSVTVNGTPAVFLTKPKEMYKFVEQSEDAVKVYDKKKMDDKDGVVIYVDETQPLQTWMGFGASITESSAHNLYLLDEERRNAVMAKLFDEDDGIGLTICRQPIGISDFSLEVHSYDDVEGDTNLEHFSIDCDKEKVIPLLKQAKKLAGDDFKIFSLPWTPPLWMKTVPEFHTLNGSQLKREYYGVYADYLVKYIQAYGKEGLPIFALTPQNEISGQHGIPSCYYSSIDNATFVNQYLRPAMDKAGLDTKLLAWEFNWFDSAMDYTASTYDSIDAVSFHVYGGNISVQDEIHALFPDLPIYTTEGAGAKSAPGTGFLTYMKQMTNSLRHYSSTHLMWNIMLDENRGPFLEGDGYDMNPVGTALIEYDKENDQVAYNEDFYALAHFSKFIRPGATVLTSTDTTEKWGKSVQNAVALNENGAAAVVLTNGDAEDHTFKIVVGKKVIEYTVPAKSGATITWDANVY